MADIGYIALLLALTASIYSVIAFIFGARRNLFFLSTAHSCLRTSGLTEKYVSKYW
ncbi:hypothetical protein ACFLUU_06660 [Chloroflexota bacterium]